MKPLTDTPRLFCILGNTLCNIDTDIRNFSEQLRIMMDSQDLLLIDTFVKGEVYKPRDDIFMDPERYSDAFQNWLAHAFAYYNGRTIHDVNANFGSWIEPDYKNVDNSTDIYIKQRHRGRRFLRIARHTQEDLKRWIQTPYVHEGYYFELVRDNTFHGGSRNGIKRAVMLFRAL